MCSATLVDDDDDDDDGSGLSMFINGY